MMSANHLNVDSLTLRDEWETFSFGAGSDISAVGLRLSKELADKLDAAYLCDDDILAWTWDTTRERLGDDAADELLDSLVTAAQEYRIRRISTGEPETPSFDEKRRLLEHRWAGSTIQCLGLQRRTRNLLHAHGIITLGDLLKGLQPLCSTLCYDLPAFIDIWERLIALELRHGEPLQEWEHLLADEACTASLDDVAAHMRQACKKNEWKVLGLRYGIEDDASGTSADSVDDDNRERERCTLDEAGRALGLTRERARQIEQRALLKLQELEAKPWQSLTMTLAYLMRDFGGVMSVADADQELTARFSTVSVNAEGLCHLLFELSDCFIAIRRGSIYGLASMPIQRYPFVIRQAIEACKNSMVNLTEEELSRQVYEGLVSEGTAIELAFVEACLRTDGRFSSELSRRDLNFLIVETLRSIGKPAHFTEVTARLNTSGWRGWETASKSVHARLVSARDLFVYLDRGVYGLAEWGSEDRREFDRYKNGLIGDHIEAFLTQRDKAADTADIIAYVLSKKRCQENSVRLCLSQDQRFDSFGRGKYGLKKWVM